MTATFRHFAINAGDTDRARSFYEAVFGWTFVPWGPPGFYQTRDAGSGMMGALQERPAAGAPSTFMTTFQVEDIRATLKAVETHGGTIVMPPFKIEGVGEIAYFTDCEGNTTGIGQYEPGHWR